MTTKTLVTCDRCGRDLSEESQRAGDRVAIFMGTAASMTGAGEYPIRLDFCKNCWDFVKSNLPELIQESVG